MLMLSRSIAERTCSDSACTASSVPPPSSQPVGARGHLAFGLPEVSSASLKYFSQMGLEVRRSGLCTSAHIFRLGLPLCLLKCVYPFLANVDSCLYCTWHGFRWFCLIFPGGLEDPDHSSSSSPASWPPRVDGSPGVLSPLRARLSPRPSSPYSLISF